MLKEMLLELEYKVAGIAKNFQLANEILQKDSSINFAILDINLSEEKTGMDVAALILNEFKFPFIFLTSYSDKKTFHQAVEFKPEAYLIKPFTKTDLFTTLEIIRSRVATSEKFTSIKDGHLTVKLKHSSILFIKSDNIYLEIKTNVKTHVIRTSLEGFLEEMNDSSFIRIHRSYAVNIQHVSAVNGQFVIVNHERIPLSRKFRDEVLEKYRRT